MTRRVVAASYVGAVAALATYGFATGSPAPILLAVVVALPGGVAGLVGYYVAYGLLVQVPGVGTAAWFLPGVHVIGVVLIAAGAAGNVVLLVSCLPRGRGSGRVRPPSPPGTPP